MIKQAPQALSISRRVALALPSAVLLAPFAQRAARAQPTPRRVRVGVLGDYAGGKDLGGPGSAVAARLAAVDAVAAMPGWTVEIVAADHNNKPDVASTIARGWFDTGEVDAITDLAISSVGLAVARLAAEKNRTVLISGAATSDLTGSACTATSTHWADDTYVLSAGLGRALVEQHQRKWYILAINYALGEAMLRDVSETVKAAGGEVVGSARFPSNTTDFSSYLLSAQASGADVIALASTGTDTISAIKQAEEFGLRQGGQQLVGMLTFITDIHALGLKTAQGMFVASQYYWDDNEVTRAFAMKFFATEQRMPSKLQAATYAAVRHYLETIGATGSKDAVPVNAAMRQRTVDFFGQSAHIRADGRVIYDLGLYQMKAPSESHGPWDLYRRVGTIHGETAFRPMGFGCTLA